MTAQLQQVLSAESIQLYQQELLNHHKAPIGFELEFEVTNEAEGVNAACGDEIMIHVQVQAGVISALAFSGDSCAICRASASMMCQHLTNQPIAQVEPIIAEVVAAINLPSQEIEQFDKTLAPLLAVRKFPVRKQCAILPWRTISLALTN